MRLMSSKQQVAILKRIEERRCILENAVVSVVKGFSSALFVYGSPGLGKSHLLTTMLEGIEGEGWCHHTAHVTPAKLVRLLQDAPRSIHLFEDCEKLIKTDLCASILRAACGAPNDRERWVSYETMNENIKFVFAGGVIIATNGNLSRLNGPLQGVASRFRPIRWELTLEERVATILKMSERECIKGGVPLSAKECRKVALRLIELCSASQSPLDLDLRLYAEHALPAFAQAKQDPVMKWEDLLQAKLLGVATTISDTQLERTRHLQQLAQKINSEEGNSKAKVAKWKKLTELGQAMYFRHLKQGKAAATQA